MCSSRSSSLRARDWIEKAWKRSSVHQLLYKVRRLQCRRTYDKNKGDGTHDARVDDVACDLAAERFRSPAFSLGCTCKREA